MYEYVVTKRYPNKKTIFILLFVLILTVYFIDII